jgi:hypothetical protein
VRLSPLGTSATVGLLYQPRMIDDDYGAVGGMRIGRGNRSSRRKPAPVPVCSPQIPHDLGSNPGRRGGKPATNRLSYGTASLIRLGVAYSPYELTPTQGLNQATTGTAVTQYSD